MKLRYSARSVESHVTLTDLNNTGRLIASSLSAFISKILNPRVSNRHPLIHCQKRVVGFGNKHQSFSQLRRFVFNFGVVDKIIIIIIRYLIELIPEERFLSGYYGYHVFLKDYLLVISSRNFAVSS